MCYLSSIANSQLYIELIFVNTDPETIEQKLETKNTTKTRKKRAIVVKTDDKDEGGNS